MSSSSSLLFSPSTALCRGSQRTWTAPTPSSRSVRSSLSQTAAQTRSAEPFSACQADLEGTKKGLAALNRALSSAEPQVSLALEFTASVPSSGAHQATSCRHAPRGSLARRDAPAPMRREQTWTPSRPPSSSWQPSCCTETASWQASCLRSARLLAARPPPPCT